jgi:hypothetical protein
MRTVWLILGTVLTIALATALYTWFQPKAVHHASVVQRLASEAPTAQAPPRITDSSSIVQSGDDVWVKVPDKTGQLAWQFRSSRYDPQPDGSINVTKPQAEFYFAGGQIVSIRGTHGHVVIPADATKSTEMRGAMAPPSRGELYDVTVSLYHTTNPRHAVLVCKMNNISFDNDTFRIATEQFTDPSGNVIPADQVPVAVRGDDYDFDGKGMVIRWDDRDHRLQSLEIAHGDSLTVKSQEALRGITPVSETTASPTTPPPVKTVAVVSPKPAAKPPVKSAQARNKKPAPAPTTTTKPTTQKAEQPVYRATFYGGVHVTQSDQPLAVSDTMQIDFKSQDENENPPANAAAPQTSDQPKKSAAPTTRRAVAKSAALAQTPPPTTQQAPVIIHWPGKLVVVPLEKDVPKLEPGQRNIEMISTATPVVLDHNGSEVQCASFFYGGADDSLVLRSSPAVPIISMKDANGAMVYTPSLKYNGTDKKAYLDGPSHAEVPIQNAQSNSTDLMKTKWTQSCVLTMAGENTDQMQIEKANLVGDVDVDHPKLKLKSDTLDVGFAPPADAQKGGSNQLKDLTADGNVKCDMIDEQQKKRHIDSDHLVVTTEKSADGQLSPKTLTADGHVHTLDDEDDLKAGHLYAKLGPTTQPGDSPQMQSLFAQENVKFAFKDSTGTCDQLTADADADGDDYNVKLYGQPSATVVSKQSTLTGPIINLQPKRQNVQVVGAGTMHGVQQENPNSKAAPFDIAWNSGLNFNGATNLGDASSDIVVKTISADGTINTATGDKLLIEMMDDPTSTTKPTTRRATTSPMDFDTGNKKQLKNLTITGNSEVKSILNNPKGDLIRRTHLFAPLVRVEAFDKRMVVPAPGRMLYEDLRSTSQSAPTTGPAAPLGDMSGATAFQWDRELIYDQNENQAQLLGNVLIVHQPLDEKGEPFRLDSQQVTVDFEPSSAKGQQPSDSKMKTMTAAGSVQFMSRQIRFESDRMIFDTINNRLTAFGTEHQPVDIYDDSGVSSAIVNEAWWDTRTQQMGMHDISANMRH